MDVKKNIWMVIVMIGLGLILTPLVQAGTSIPIFSFNQAFSA